MAITAPLTPITEVPDDHILLTNDYLKRRVAAGVPGSYYEPGRGWFLDPARDLSATRAALHLFPEVWESIPDDIRTRLDVSSSLRPPDLVTGWVGSRLRADLLPGIPEELRDRLYDYQVHDVAFACARIRQDGGDYLGWDRGLGKTLGAVVVSLELGVDRLVVVCPNASKESVWRPEIEKWDVEGRFTGRVFNLGGDAKRRARTLAEWKLYGGVLLVHYEALRLVESWGAVDLVICDESHRLANGSASRKAPAFYKALMKIKPTYKLALSGSVVINSPEDMFGAAHWLFPTRYKSKWRDWNDRFFQYMETGFGKELIGVKPDMLEPLQHELSAWLQIRRKQDELPGLPDRIDQTLRVELSPTQRKVYDDLAASFMATLPDGDLVVAGSVLAQLTKLRQIATGLDLLGEEFTDSAKLDLAVQMVQDNAPDKTVVFAWHRATCNAMQQRLTAAGIQSVVVDGDVRQNHRAARVNEFQTSTELTVIIATIKTLGESVTLHAAADLIFLESSWTPADMEQAADRVYRIGQNRRVTVTNIVAADTVDEYRVLPRLKTKAELRALVLGGDSNGY